MKTCCICGKSENETKIIGSYCRKHYLQLYKHGKIIDRTIYDKNKITVTNETANMELYDKDGNISGVTTFDSKFVDKVSQYKWYIRYSGSKNHKLPYVMGTINGKKIFLHRFLLECGEQNKIDHIDRNTMNNKLENLRECTSAENSRNRIYKSSNGKHPGVYQQYENGNWTARICYNYKTIHLGTFSSYEEALKARIKAEQEYFGEFAVSGQ